jgi:DNA-directed RNA polymerase subunit RPC12/RpoP
MITVTGGLFDELMESGRLMCSLCGGRVIRWGWDQTRMVRAVLDRFGVVWLVRRHRVRCKRCGATHVVTTRAFRPRHVDAAHVIAAALAIRSGGFGFRVAAGVVDRAVSTVRGWYRAAAGPAVWVGVLTASGV